ncbi:chromate transporter [bacterium]|nr:chromate transporter [bacterium]
MDKNIYNIFKLFLKVGMLLLGGGYVILPLLQSELVEKRAWIDENELYDFYALSQSVPGIIAANVSIFTGYKLRKIPGAISAIVGITLPAFVSIVILAQIMGYIIKFRFIESMFWGIGIGVLTLIFLAVKEMWARSVVNRRTSVLFFAAFILSAFFKISPAIIIIISIIIGILMARFLPEKKEDKVGQ